MTQQQEWCLVLIAPIAVVHRRTTLGFVWCWYFLLFRAGIVPFRILVFTYPAWTVPWPGQFPFSFWRYTSDFYLCIYFCSRGGLKTDVLNQGVALVQPPLRQISCSHSFLLVLTSPQRAGAFWASLSTVSLFHRLCTNGSNNFLYMRGFWISVSSPVCFSRHRNFLWNLRSHVSKPNSFSSSKNPRYSY